jgi:hypothetical protein
MFDRANEFKITNISSEFSEIGLVIMEIESRKSPQTI